MVNSELYPAMHQIFRFNTPAVVFLLALLSGCSREPGQSSSPPAPEAEAFQPYTGETVSSQRLAVLGVTTVLSSVENLRTASAAPQEGPTHVQQGDVVFSDYGYGVAYIALKDGKEHVVHNGRGGMPCTGVASLTVSPDGRRVSYRCDMGTKQQMVIDGIKKQAYDNVRNQVYSPDSRHLAYLAQVGNTFRIILDDRIVDECSGVNDLTFSNDSTKLMYISRTEGLPQARFVLFDLKTGKKVVKECLDAPYVYHRKSDRIALTVVEGDKQRLVDFAIASSDKVKRTEAYDLITNISIGLDGKSVAFIAHRGAGRYLVANGREERLPDKLGVNGPPQVRPDLKGAGIILATAERYNNRYAFHQAFLGGAPGMVWYDKAQDLVYGGKGSVAYAAKRGEKWFVVLNGKEGPEFDMVVTPMFSPDGRKLVYRARDKGKRFVVVADAATRDHRRQPEYEMVFQAAFSEDGRSVAYGVKDGNQLVWKVEKL